MFGKLTLEAIPFHVPIVMGTLVGIIVIGLALLGAITYYKKWQVLWQWFISMDHKKIGVMYIVVALVMLVRGYADGIMMRTQLLIAHSGDMGYLPPSHYDQIFTAHGVIMLLFVVMPLLTGLMNIVVPLQIGARDVAFPYLNSVSFWLFVAGVVLIMISLVVGEFAHTGWVAYPPLSGKEFGPDVGVDYYIWSVALSGTSSLLTGVNFFATILKMRTPDMPLMKMPIFVWTILCTCVIILGSFPIVTVALVLLALDRYLDFHFFTADLGGDPTMYVNLFWAWGHPEVYILILPAFGVFSEVTATFARKYIFGYASMVWATVAITFLSFIVWLHHFFAMGSGASVNAFFGITTMIIAIPTGVKIFTWLFTMYKGRIHFELPMYWTVAFVVTFSIGGMTGVLLAVPGADFLLHNTLYLVAHFHNVLIGGALFGYFAGIYYWFPKVYGFKMEKRFGVYSFWCWVIGFYLAFMPLYMLGFMGVTRRMQHYLNDDWIPYMQVAFVGALFIGLGIIFLGVQIVLTFKQSQQHIDVTGDPWNGRTLEWATSSPPPEYNFAVTPQGSELDMFHVMKEKGFRPVLRKSYEAIHLPKGSAAGVILGVGSVLLGFALTWYIWWLAAVALVAAIVVTILRSYDQDIDHYVQPDEVLRTEQAHINTLNTVQPLKA